MRGLAGKYWQILWNRLIGWTCRSDPFIVGNNSMATKFGRPKTVCSSNGMGKGRGMMKGSKGNENEYINIVPWVVLHFLCV